MKFRVQNMEQFRCNKGSSRSKSNSHEDCPLKKEKITGCKSRDLRKYVLNFQLNTSSQLGGAKFNRILKFEIEGRYKTFPENLSSIHSGI